MLRSYHERTQQLFHYFQPKVSGSEKWHLFNSQDKSPHVNVIFDKSTGKFIEERKGVHHIIQCWTAQGKPNVYFPLLLFTTFSNNASGTLPWRNLCRFQPHLPSHRKLLHRQQPRHPDPCRILQSFIPQCLQKVQGCFQCWSMGQGGSWTLARKGPHFQAAGELACWWQGWGPQSPSLVDTTGVATWLCPNGPPNSGEFFFFFFISQI